MNAKVLRVEEAARLVKPGMTLAIGASSWVSTPDAVMAALGREVEETGAPGDLRVVFPVNVGDLYGQPGLDPFAGLSKKAYPGFLLREAGEDHRWRAR